MHAHHGKDVRSTYHKRHILLVTSQCTINIILEFLLDGKYDSIIMLI